MPNNTNYASFREAEDALIQSGLSEIIDTGMGEEVAWWMYQNDAGPEYAAAHFFVCYECYRETVDGRPSRLWGHPFCEDCYTKEKKSLNNRLLRFREILNTKK